MKRVLILAVAASASLAGAPALTQAPPPPASPAIAQEGGSPFPADLYRTDRREFGRCFDGRQVVGVNRAGDTLYVQALSASDRSNRQASASIYRMTMPRGCASLSEATSLAVRSSSDLVCEGSGARIEFKTSSGVKSCKVSMIRALGRAEIAQLASPAKP